MMKLARLLVIICLASFVAAGAGCKTTKDTGTLARDIVELTTPGETGYSKFSKPGFIAEEKEGRLLVRKPGQEMTDKHITLIGAGPGGMTLKSPDRETALAYLAAKPGFMVEVEEGRVWVQKPGQEKSDKHTTLVGAGPLGATLKAPDRDTAMEYLAAKSGFIIEMDEGRIWVRKPGQEKSEKHITRVGAGPGGATVKAVDAETLNAYLK